MELYKVLHYVAIMNRAGQETFLMNVFRNLNREEVIFDFLVVIPQKGDYDQEINDLGGKVRLLRIDENKSPYKRLHNFWILYKYLKTCSKEYVAFHIHTQHAMDASLDAFAAKLAGFRKVIVHSHSTNTLHHVKAHHLFQPLLRMLPVVRLACSHKAGKWLYGKDNCFEVICNGIDTKRFGYDQALREKKRKEFGWENKTVIGHVGSFSYPKNHEFLIRVFYEIHKDLPDAILVLVGCGGLREQIEQQVKTLEIENCVEFLGSRADIDVLDQCFDLFLFPSRYEGLPVTLVEAQSTGLPCLISDSITNEVKITDNVFGMSLADPVEKWAQKAQVIIGSTLRHKACEEEVTEAGYNILSVVDRLNNIYLM